MMENNENVNPQAQWLTERLADACRGRGCPLTDIDCSFLKDCNKMTPADWLRVAAEAVQGEG